MSDTIPTHKRPKQPLLWVDICEARPNKLFTEQQRQAVRFLRYNRRVPCAACGKKVRIHMTMLCQFKAGDLGGSFGELKFYPKSFPPLTPVCGDHPVAPDFPVDSATHKALAWDAKCKEMGI